MRNLSIGAVDLFCGIGGLTYGLRKSGIPVIAGIDIDPACEYPFEVNNNAAFFLRDVAKITEQELDAIYGNTEIRVLAGCAPCQPFSTYSQSRRALDNRWQLLDDFLRLAVLLRPEIVTMENVTRLALCPIWTKFVNELTQTGYHVVWSEEKCELYGVPQTRKRLVLLASRLGPIGLPEPTVEENGAVTVRETISHLNPIAAGESDKNDALHMASTLNSENFKRMRASKPGGTWRDWPEELRAACHRRKKGETYPSVYGRMCWDSPAPTITTQFYGFGNGRFGHPEQDRAISIREAALLQTFPDDYVFLKPEETPTFRRLGILIGNAVPPKLGEAIGHSIMENVSRHLH